MVICFAVYRVRRHIEDTIEYCKSKTDNEGGSATCNKMLRNMYPGEDRISCYGLRHGTRNMWVKYQPYECVFGLGRSRGWRYAPAVRR